RSNQIDGNWLAWILRLEVRDIALHAIDQLVVRGTEVGATGVGRVVSIPCCRWPRVQVARAGEPLANNSGSDDFAVSDDQLPVRFVVEEQLRKAGHHQRVDDS